MLRSFGIETTSILLSFLVDKVWSRVSYRSGSDKLNEEICIANDGAQYTCREGHCCENDGCCPYYYELWWFWLIWVVIILACFCCIYRLRQCRKRHHLPRGLTPLIIEEVPYAGVCNYPGPPPDNNILGHCKLPLYQDVIQIPPSASPPPPYSSRRHINNIAYREQNNRGETTWRIVPCSITSSMLSLASLSHYIPGLRTQNSISVPQISNSGEDVIVSQDSDDNSLSTKLISAVQIKGNYLTESLEKNISTTIDDDDITMDGVASADDMSDIPSISSSQESSSVSEERSKLRSKGSLDAGYLSGYDSEEDCVLASESDKITESTKFMRHYLKDPISFCDKEVKSPFLKQTPGRKEADAIESDPMTTRDDDVFEESSDLSSDDD